MSNNWFQSAKQSRLGALGRGSCSPCMKQSIVLGIVLGCNEVEGYLNAACLCAEHASVFNGQLSTIVKLFKHKRVPRMCCVPP